MYSRPDVLACLESSASAGTYANLVKQAKSKQKIIDKMEAAGLIKEVPKPRVLSFKFEDVTRLPPPIIAFSEVAFAYSGKKQDYLYRDLSMGIDMDSRIAIVGDNGCVAAEPSLRLVARAFAR